MAPEPEILGHVKIKWREFFVRSQTPGAFLSGSHALVENFSN